LSKKDNLGVPNVDSKVDLFWPEKSILEAKKSIKGDKKGAPVA